MPILTKQDLFVDNKTDEFIDYDNIKLTFYNLLDKSRQHHNDLYFAMSTGKDISKIQENIDNLNIEIDTMMFLNPWLAYV